MSENVGIHPLSSEEGDKPTEDMDVAKTDVVLDKADNDNLKTTAADNKPAEEMSSISPSLPTRESFAMVSNTDLPSVEQDTKKSDNTDSTLYNDNTRQNVEEDAQEEVPRSSSSFDIIDDEDVESIAHDNVVGVKEGQDIPADTKQLDDLFKYKQSQVPVDEMCKWSTASTCSNDTIAQQRLFSESILTEAPDDKSVKDDADESVDMVVDNTDDEVLPVVNEVEAVVQADIAPTAVADSVEQTETAPEDVSATTEPVAPEPTEPVVPEATEPVVSQPAEPVAPAAEETVEEIVEVTEEIKPKEAVEVEIADEADTTSNEEPVLEDLGTKSSVSADSSGEPVLSETINSSSSTVEEPKPEPEKVEESDLNSQTAQENKKNEPVVTNAEAPKEELKKVADTSEPVAAEEPAEEKAPEEEKKVDEWVQILGNDSLKKKIKKEGKGENLEKGQQVQIKYSMALSDGQLVDDNVEVTFQLGDGEVIDAIDLTANLAKVGECYEVLTQARFGYGVLGRPPHIGSNCGLLITVEIIQAEDTPKMGDMTEAERVKIGDRKRKIGNDHFARQDFGRATTNYRGACKYLDPPSYEVTGEPSAEVKDLQTKTWCNLALSELKGGRIANGMQAVTRALEIDPKNTKALYRKGKLLEQKGELEEAEKALKAAVSIEPNSPGCKQFLKELSKKIANQKKKQQQMYKKMLNLEEEAGEKKTKTSSFGERETTWLEGAIPMVAGAVTIGALAVAAYNGLRSFQG